MDQTMKGIYKYHVVDRCFPFLLVFSDSGNSNPPCGFIYHYCALKKDLVSLAREKMRAEEGCARSFSGFLSPTSCKQLSSHCLPSDLPLWDQQVLSKESLGRWRCEEKPQDTENARFTFTFLSGNENPCKNILGAKGLLDLRN